MWTVKANPFVEQQFGLWYATFGFDHTDGRTTSALLQFPQGEPTAEQLDAAGNNHARKMTLAEAPVADLNSSIPREEFYSRFTVEEIASIYAAAQAEPMVLAYVKLLEINPSVNKEHPALLEGLSMLEGAQLIAPGRANKIMGW